MAIADLRFLATDVSLQFASCVQRERKVRRSAHHSVSVELCSDLFQCPRDGLYGTGGTFFGHYCGRVLNELAKHLNRISNALEVEPREHCSASSPQSRFGFTR